MLDYYREANGDYLCVEPDTNDYYRRHFGREEFEGRATAIAGLVGSVCTTGVSRAFLAGCTPVARADVPQEWLVRFGD